MHRDVYNRDGCTTKMSCIYKIVEDGELLERFSYRRVEQRMTVENFASVTNKRGLCSREVQNGNT